MRGFRNTTASLPYPYVLAESRMDEGEDEWYMHFLIMIQLNDAVHHREYCCSRLLIGPMTRER